MTDSTSNIRFAPSILTRLGEELVPNLDQAIVELVRNAYDADATLCRIQLEGTTQDNGRITLSDNGDGMDADGVKNGWLVLGGSSKTRSGVTNKGRRTVGDKGLGRLAALRAGHEAILTTRSKDSSPNAAIEAKIHWKDFEGVKIVEEVPITIATTSRSEVGTTIILDKIRRRLTVPEVDRLGRSIVLLTSPFEGQSDFRVDLVAPDYPQLEARVKQAYLEDAEFKLVAELGSNGIGFVKVFDWKENVVYSSSSEDWFVRKKDHRPTYDAPTTTFELYNYVLKKNAFTGRQATIGEVREWLKIVGGVHFYHRRFRVPPYGDPGHDWLDMNLARARSPEERPSTNNSVGRVIVDDPDGILLQKTDRFGFVESHEFLEIRRFAKDALDWFARQRLRDAESRRDTYRKEAHREPQAAREQLEQLISESVPEGKRETTLQALTAMDRAYTRALDSNREDLLLYRSLATAGTTAAVFAHEIGKPITAIIGSQKRIRSRSENLRPKHKVAELKGPLDLIVSAAKKLANFAGMQIDFLRKDKRRHGIVSVSDVVANVNSVWAPVLKDARIELVLELEDSADVGIYGAEALLETVVTNCLTNAVRAFETKGARSRGRKIAIRSRSEGDTVALEIEDNGLGIEMPLDEIWLPGKTTQLTGTGFGLTIVKDSVLDMNGTYSAQRQGAMEGAFFRFVFPRITGTE